jgi:hypothetical protein
VFWDRNRVKILEYALCYIPSFWALKEVAMRGLCHRPHGNIKQDLNIVDLGEKIKEYQQNYFEHILTMPTYRIPWKLFDCNPNGRRERGRPTMRWKDHFS